MTLPVLKRPLLRCRFRGWQLSLSAPPILFLGLALPVLTQLTFWQLDRAGQRKQANDAVEAVWQQSPVPASDTGLLDLDIPFIHTLVEGKPLWEKQFLLDEQIHNTVSGYEVLLPILFGTDSALLLSRGWMPITLNGKPDLSPPKHTPLHEVSINGLAVIPPRRMSDQQRTIFANQSSKHGNSDTAIDWPIVIHEEDFATLSSQLGLELVPRVLQPGAIEFGYRQIWKPVRRGPMINYGYAAQWFGLAVLLLGCTIGMNIKRLDNHSG